MLIDRCVEIRAELVRRGPMLLIEILKELLLARARIGHEGEEHHLIASDDTRPPPGRS